MKDEELRIAEIVNNLTREQKLILLQEDKWFQRAGYDEWCLWHDETPAFGILHNDYGADDTGTSYYLCEDCLIKEEADHLNYLVEHYWDKLKQEGKI